MLNGEKKTKPEGKRCIWPEDGQGDSHCAKTQEPGGAGGGETSLAGLGPVRRLRQKSCLTCGLTACPSCSPCLRATCRPTSAPSADRISQLLRRELEPRQSLWVLALGETTLVLLLGQPHS